MHLVLKQLLTGRDNETHEIARWLGTVAFLVGMIMSVYSVVYKGQPFSIQEYGIGIGALIAALGAAIKLGEGDEPDPKVETKKDN
jgi:hypothetical protein